MKTPLDELRELKADMRLVVGACAGDPDYTDAAVGGMTGMFADRLSAIIAKMEAQEPVENRAALRAVYDAFCAMDNGDEPLEKYPQRAVDALARAGWAVVPCAIPYTILGEAMMTLETGNPKLTWDFIIAKTRIYPFCAIDASAYPGGSE